jgi:hypothetical protein
MQLKSLGIVIKSKCFFAISKDNQHSFNDSRLIKGNNYFKDFTLSIGMDEWPKDGLIIQVKNGQLRQINRGASQCPFQVHQAPTNHAYKHFANIGWRVFFNTKRHRFQGFSFIL